MTNYIEINKCRCCEGTLLVPFVDFKQQPLANYFHTANIEPTTYPLSVNVCTTCWHSQLSIVVPPDDLFKHYVYVSGTSETLKDYFDWFAMWSHMLWSSKSNYPTKCQVLDIACNDGTQLDSYAAIGCETYGIDPAKNIVPLAQQKGHSVICDYWSEEIALDKYTPGFFDIIVAQNVFAHVHDVMDFLMGCKRVLSNRGILLIQTSQADMIKNGEFDTIYHEHLSFFNAKSMKAICDRADLTLNQIVKTSIHGKSYVFIVTKTEFLHNNIKDIMLDEYETGLYRLSTYETFGKEAMKRVDDLKNMLLSIKLIQNLKLVGYGAAAKGMTVLNAGGIDLDYIVDDNSLKQNLYTPGMNIPVVNQSVLQAEENAVAIVPLAWNFYDEIYNKIKLLRPDKEDIFIQYFPTLQYKI